MKDEKQVVLACIDGSTLSDAVCDYATWISQRIDAPLKLMHTIDHHHEKAASTDLSGSIGLDSRDHLLEDIANQEQQQGKVLLQKGKSLLEKARQRVVEDGITDPIACLRHGGLIGSLIELEDSIRVLVIGARGKIHEHQADQLGAKLESMIRSLHRPILVAYGAFKAPESIMIAYDASEAADKAVTMVANSPLYKGLTCHLVYASKNGHVDIPLETTAEKLRIAGVEVISACLQGKPVHKLCEYQANQGIDMMIMGAFGHSRIHDLVLGSFTVKMLTHTKKPLLLLR